MAYQPKATGIGGLLAGVAGVAVALAKLHQETRRNTYARSARAALVYERAQFNNEQGNWPDLRTEQPGFAVSWCHGEPGIGLGRACLWGIDLWDERCEEEITKPSTQQRPSTTSGLITCAAAQ